MENKTLGSRIKEERKKSKMTQGELAKLANISRSYLADLEGDRYSPSIETLNSLSKSLKVTKSYLLEGEFPNGELTDLMDLFVDTYNRIEEFSKAYLALSEYSITLNSKNPDINTHTDKKELNEVLNVNVVRVDSYKEYLINDYILMKSTKEKLLKSVDEHSKKIEQIMLEIENK